VNTDRKTVTWFIGIIWLLNVLMVVYHVRTILLHASRPISVWFDVALGCLYLSGASFGVAQWALLKEWRPVQTWGLLWASSVLLFAVSTSIAYWHINVFSCLAFAFALQQILFYARFNPDSQADPQVSSDA
jgi:hypothetical protein